MGLIELDGVSKAYGGERTLLDVLRGRDPDPVRALDDVSLRVERSETYGLLGESGAGKTTLCRLLVALDAPSAGTVRFDGRDVHAHTGSEERAFRARVQPVFQDPYESLNPTVPVGRTVAEPLVGRLDGPARRERVRRVLADVGLTPTDAYVDARPRELSGGERQRVALARALASDPDVIVLDEPVSMLDARTRAAVLARLADLQADYGLTYVLVSHDYRLVRGVCDRVAVLYRGRVVERGPAATVLADPHHPYTAALRDATPTLDPTTERRHADVTPAVTDADDPPSGCRFHLRCPRVVPPDDWSGSRDAFRRALRFRRRVAERDPVLDGHADADAVLAHGLVLDLPRAHRTASERDSGGTRVDPDALDLGRDERAALDAAAAAIVRGDDEAAEAALRGVVETACAREAPAERTVDGSTVTCHDPVSSERDA
ncbi:peptide/nickel transport system ATP-binding protein [Halarchaeum solikamskense]|uniref:oligopeptide/dipeptide ABC transporter ATP-binding protein n=1 Tax=Halarchaeum nitratireducens TaxID=489913 RepID=UPI001B3AD8E0|nr:peptide/nickel transport system ATP-binding protein [Halarchaeum solikamskense]